MNIGKVFQYYRLIQFSKVFKAGNPKRNKICLRDHVADDVRDMFIDRARLHKKGYQHRVAKIIDCMLVSFV
jgi:HD superfamily phosphohydrolase